MKAIEEGIFTAMTKTKMEEFEQRLSEIEEKILIEQLKNQELSDRIRLTNRIKSFVIKSIKH